MKTGCFNCSYLAIAYYDGKTLVCSLEDSGYPIKDITWRCPFHRWTPDSEKQLSPLEKLTRITLQKMKEKTVKES